MALAIYIIHGFNPPHVLVNPSPNDEVNVLPVIQKNDFMVRFLQSTTQLAHQTIPTHGNMPSTSHKADHPNPTHARAQATPTHPSNIPLPVRLNARAPGSQISEN
ncbi:hypothetical protein MMC08_002386 [Hypocenomyce scalaris]|nr:hypothetical protein [Hypocenomyce scalaris]